MDLLPPVDDADAPRYDLDLTNATLEYFDLVDRRVGTVVLRYARLFSSNNLSRCAFHGPVWFTGTRVGDGRLGGRFRCDDAVFHQRAWFSGVEFGGPVSCERTDFRRPVKFSGSTFADRVSLAGPTFAERADFNAVHFGHDAELSGTSFRSETLTSGITTAPGGRTALPEGWHP